MGDTLRLRPGQTIGILGGGQLGRMLALAAARLSLKAHVYVAEPDAPAAEIAAALTRAAYDDLAALAHFASEIDVVTSEFENVPAAAAAALSAKVPVRPSPKALAIAQDRVAEKDFVTGLGLSTARYEAVDTRAALDAALTRVGLPAILKSRRLGYDGKGQAALATLADADHAWSGLGGAPAILEARVPFVQELSVVLARGVDGAVAAYDPSWNIHANGILARSIVPSGVGEDCLAEAVAIARRIAEGLSYVGVLAVELFRLSDNRLLVNEIAPRVHNSGHWTIDACVTSQFEQHIRAVAGWPLGTCARHSDAVMDNLIGNDIDNWETLAAEPGAALHLYGKAEARPGRKMGHVTRVYTLGQRPTDADLRSHSLTETV